MVNVVPDLAESLELIADEGPDVLHRGELAELVSRDVLDHAPDLVAAARVFLDLVDRDQVLESGSTAIVQVLAGFLGGLSLQAAVDHPRREGAVRIVER